MVDAHVDEAALVDQVSDAIRHRFAVGQRQKVVHMHAGLFSFRLPFVSIVFQGANPFFFLAIHRNDRIALLLKLLTLTVDVFKLGISIGM